MLRSLLLKLPDDDDDDGVDDGGDDDEDDDDYDHKNDDGDGGDEDDDDDGRTLQQYISPVSSLANCLFYFIFKVHRISSLHGGGS